MCGDLIRREDAIEAIDFEKVYMTAYLGYVNEGNPLKQYNKGLDDAIKAINKLPSAEPERKKGEWKEHKMTSRDYGKIYYQHDCCCNLYESPYNYCPNCGAEMERGDR